MGRERVLMVSHYYPPHVGGIEIVASNEAKRLAALGHTVCVVTSRTHGDPASGTEDGVRVVRVPAFNGLEAKGIPFPIFSPMLPLRLWQETRRADIVHIHDVFYLSSLCAAFMAWVLRRPTIITQHVAMVPHPSAITRRIEHLVYRTSGAWILRRSSRVITINSRVTEFLIDLGVAADKIVSLPNGVDTELFRPPTARGRTAARKAFDLPPQAFIVLFIGRYAPKKGFDLMRQAAGRNYLTVFAGGETTAAIRPAKHERFLGRLSQSELAMLYQAADIFALPSTGEGFPLTAQEAMASGTPVILCYDEGYRQYGLTTGTAILLPSPGVTALKHAIVALQRDDKRRRTMARSARRYALARFSWAHHITGLRRLYLAALDERSLAP